MVKATVIVRTRNDDRYLGQVLSAIRKQTYEDYEILVVDDNSSDKTLNIAKKYKSRIVNIPKGKFTHPFSSNLASINSKGKYLVFLNGHSIPISKTWLDDGLSNFKDKKVAGVYSIQKALRDANPIEKFVYSLAILFRNKRFEIDKIENVGMGTMGTTNAILRKDLWLKHKFNERHEMGGEDLEWARYWVNKGYKIIHDPRIMVYHSHNLGPVGLIKQYLGWRKMMKPNKFQAQKRNF